ncbi:hypothetical protein [Pisciglobus halotolerans]|uniref:Nudix hydrolase domain-containing protein n=1 Tax=Pisciglobus halotolerans TaxID=745365 RepID=A0A1I3DJU2_9LACT|nr:hypothetical protein [Pisciglobus halotolerans]SFH86987.1 hypothetical protein SAMN04489868_1412 [Pisciglobus halotolerans]
MTEEQWVAGTVLAKGKDGKYLFLVEDNQSQYSLPWTTICNDKTGLACIIEELKRILKVEATALNLYDLSNAVIKGYRVPLFVFTLEDEKVNAEQSFGVGDEQFSWEPSTVLIQTLGNVEISGVPHFNH